MTSILAKKTFNYLSISVCLVLFSGAVFAEDYDYKTLLSDVTLEYRGGLFRYYIDEIGDLYDSKQPVFCCKRRDLDIITRRGTTIGTSYLKGGGVLIAEKSYFVQVNGQVLSLFTDEHKKSDWTTADEKKLVFKEDIIANGRAAKTYFECNDGLSDSECEDKGEVVTITKGDIYKLKKTK